MTNATRRKVPIPKVEKRHKAQTTMSIPQAPWWLIRQDLPPAAKLESPTPRIVAIAHHGPGGLLRPFFPELPELPEVAISEESAARVASEESGQRLAGSMNLRLGGSSYKLKQLESLKIPEVSSQLEELEPLRAMSLKEVTNVPLLIDYTESITDG